MKTYILTLTIVLSGYSSAQITIGKTISENVPANASVSIELGNPTGGNKGIILPWVTSETAVINTNPVPGTIIFDSGTQKIKYSVSSVPNATAITGWNDLSNGALPPTVPNVADANTEQSSAKVLIGGDPATDSTPGILVLGDTDKAMILPRVASHNDIVNPSAGMMVYVTSTSQLAVYNGREWSFWGKP